MQTCTYQGEPRDDAQVRSGPLGLLWKDAAITKTNHVHNSCSAWRFLLGGEGVHFSLRQARRRGSTIHISRNQAFCKPFFRSLSACMQAEEQEK